MSAPSPSPPSPNPQATGHTPPSVPVASAPSAQLHSAPGAYAPPPVPLGTPYGGTPRRIRRQRGASRLLVITVVVLVIGLVLGAAAVVGLKLLRKDSTTNSGSKTAVLPSDDWVHGARRAWTLDVGNGGPGSGMRIAADGDQLIVASGSYTPGDSPERPNFELEEVKAYDVSGDEPQEQWSTNLNIRFHYQNDSLDTIRSQYFFTPLYWGDYLVVGGKLLSTDNGEAFDAPWDESPYIIGAYAIDCSKKNHCSARNAEDPDRKLWEADIPDSFEYLAGINFGYGLFGYVYEGNNTIALVSPSIAVDVATGELYDLHIDYSRTDETPFFGKPPFESDETARALADGWYKYNKSSGRVMILSPTGEDVESFDNALPDGVGIYLTSDHPRMTAAELKSYLRDGDTSWAHIRYDTISDAGTEYGCPALKTGDSNLESVTESGACGVSPSDPHLQPDIFVFSLSPGESVLVTEFGSVSTPTGVPIYGAWSTDDGQTINLPENEYTGFYLINPGLIVAYDTAAYGSETERSNKLIAYRPNRK